MGEIVKVKVPDGRGGYTEVEGEVASRDQYRSEEVSMERRDEQLRAETIAHGERLLKIENVHAHDANLSPRQRMLAISVMWASMYDGYPGGREEADACMREAWVIVEESKKSASARAARRTPKDGDVTDVRPGEGSFTRVRR